MEYCLVLSPTPISKANPRRPLMVSFYLPFSRKLVLMLRSRSVVKPRAWHWMDLPHQGEQSGRFTSPGLPRSIGSNGPQRNGRTCKGHSVDCNIYLSLGGRTRLLLRTSRCNPKSRRVQKYNTNCRSYPKWDSTTMARDRLTPFTILPFPRPPQATLPVRCNNPSS